MAITTSRVHQWSNGARYERIVDVTLDNSYPTGGYSLPVTNAALALRNAIHDIRPGVSTNGYVVNYIPSTGKLKVFRIGGSLTAPLTEVANAVDLSAETVRLRVTGK